MGQVASAALRVVTAVFVPILYDVLQELFSKPAPKPPPMQNASFFNSKL
jgi:hypothetical protein